MLAPLVILQRAVSQLAPKVLSPFMTHPFACVAQNHRVKLAFFAEIASETDYEHASMRTAENWTQQGGENTELDR
jgi:hypothetical protein